MIKRIFTVLAILSALIAKGQDQTSSPYSYFGIGLPVFNSTAEQRAMEGLSILGNRTHFNLQNPAALGALEFTTFTVGATQKFTTVQTNSASEKVRNTSFDYIALGVPAGKLNFGFGIIPYSSVGYKFKNQSPTSFSQFMGRGGLNKLFLSFGYRLKEGLRIGVEGSYNFGNIQNKNILFQNGIQYGTLEKNRSNLNGFRVKFGAQYEVELSEKLELKTSVSYAPASLLNSENSRHLSTISLLSSGDKIEVSTHDIHLPDTKFDLPSDLRMGVGVGETHQWFVGAEYQKIGATQYKNTSFTTNNVQFTEATIYRIGGYYTPKYNDIMHYFNRITFRAGFRYQESGLRINNKNIEEFGISFGLGLPAGQYLSNLNIGVEYGQRGTTAAGLVKEDFINIFIGISLNDKWFREKKYH